MTFRVQDRSTAVTADLLPAAPAVTLAGIVGVSVVCWVVGVVHARAMDMGVATSLGSFSFFAGSWISMMAAMMLPSAIPAMWRRGRATGRALAVAVFALQYMVIWAATGVAV